MPVEKVWEYNRRFYELPFSYVFDYREQGLGSTAPPEREFSIPQVDRDGSFCLRRIVRLNPDDPGTELIRLRKPDGSYTSSAPMRVSEQWLQVPEIVFPPNTDIRFQLSNIAPSDTGQIIFQGAVRYDKVINEWPAYMRAQKYRETQYAYVGDAEIDIASATPARGFNQLITVQVRDYPFDLQRITVSYRINGGSQPIFGFRPQDSNGHFLSSDFLNGSLFFYGGQFYSVFPTPSVIFPVGSQIRLYVTNLAGPGEDFTDLTAQVVFHGVEIIPC